MAGPILVPNPLSRIHAKQYCDREYMYTFGGRHEISNNRFGCFQILSNAVSPVPCNEFWAFNLTTHIWRRYRFDEKVPEFFSDVNFVQTSPFSSNIVLIDNFSFKTNHSTIHLLEVDNKRCVVKTTELESVGERPHVQNVLHSCSEKFYAGKKPNTFFVLGFSEQQKEYQIYNVVLKTIKVSKNGEETISKPVLYWTLMKSNAISNMYLAEKHTTEFDEKTNSIIHLSGRKYPCQNSYKTLDYIETTNLNDCQMVRFQTFPNEEDAKYPTPRYHHASCRYGRTIIIAGGLEATDRFSLKYLDDIWSLNLDTKQWTRLPFELSHRRKGHCISVTEDGRLLVFGGLVEVLNRNSTDHLEIFILNPPKLTTLALDKVRKMGKGVFEGIDGSNLTSIGSDIAKIVHRATDPIYLEEQRKEAAEKYKHLPMIETKNGWEYDNGHLWLVRRQKDPLVEFFYSRYSLELYDRGVIPEDDKTTNTKILSNYDGHILRQSDN